MKVIFVIQGLRSGGAERVVSVLSDEFSKKNIDVVIALTEQWGNIAYKINPNCVICNLTNNNKKNVLINRFLNIYKLRSLFKSENPDVVISFITRTNICAIIASIGLNIPVFVSERNNPMIDPRSKFTRLLRNLLYPWAKGCVFQTNFAMRCFSHKIQNISKVIYNPINSDIYKVSKNLQRKKRIVALCRLNKQKNLSLLIKSFANIHHKFPDYILEIYGEGEERERLEKLIYALNLENKCFLMGTTKRPLEILATSEVFALSSDYEGMSNALIEALCCGCACISTDSPAYSARELIINKKNGILVAVNDEEDFSNALNYILSDTNGRNAIMCEAQNVEAKVNTENIVKEWIDFININ